MYMGLTDRDRPFERTNCCTLLANYLPKWSKTTPEQRATEETQRRGHVGCAGGADDSYPTCIAHVQRPGSGTRDEKEAGERQDGPEEEQTTRASCQWTWKRRKGRRKCYAARCTKSRQRHDSRCGCECCDLFFLFYGGAGLVRESFVYGGPLGLRYPSSL